MAAIDPESLAFVGRTRQLSFLQGQLSRSLSGDGHIVLLSGEAGIGKTRLCQEYRRHVAGDRRPVVWGRCFDGDWTPPFQPWVEALDALSHQLGEERLRDLAGRDASLISRLLPVRTAEDFEANVSPLSAEEERFRLFDAVVQLLARGGDRAVRDRA
jgi:predicted ATPase